MYRLSELSVLSYEAVVCVDNVFVEDTPYGGAGEYSLHKNAAMLGVKSTAVITRTENVMWPPSARPFRYTIANEVGIVESQR